MPLALQTAKEAPISPSRVFPVFLLLLKSRVLSFGTKSDLKWTCVTVSRPDVPSHLIITAASYGYVASLGVEGDARRFVLDRMNDLLASALDDCDVLVFGHSHHPAVR